MYVQVNIGRNVGDKPMNEKAWDNFIHNVGTSLLLSAEYGEELGTYEVHHGTGEWDGIAEESAHVSLYSEEGFNLSGLKGMLELDRQLFSQDSIALIVGSELIEGVQS